MAALTLTEADILAMDLPDDISISDLYECGIKRGSKKPQNPVNPNSRAPLGVSSYKATFQASTSPRPRSSKKPPPTPPISNPAPMTFSTNQRTEFKNLGHVQRVKPIVHEDKYEAPQVPLDGRTFYSQEFTAKATTPAVAAGTVQKDHVRREPQPLESKTTNSETFKPWVQQPALAFTEMPSFTGSIMFPEKKPLPESTMRFSYQGKFVPPIPQIKMSSASIRIEGEHNFDTTNNAVYRGEKGGERVRPMVRKAASPVGKRDKFAGVTQSRRDFPGYHGNQPRPPKAADPAPTTIDLKFDNKRSFTTENRTTFQGHNVVEHPAPRSCKIDEGEFQPPAHKFETETSQKRDFKPIDISASLAPKMTIPASQMAAARDAKFDGHTMNMEHFKNWGHVPRVRYGDFHENMPYIPSTQPFAGESVTKASFKGETRPPIKAFKPVDRPNSNAGEKVDYTTMYQEEYRKKQSRLMRAKIFLMQQETMKRQRQGKVSSAPAGSKPIAVK